MRQVKCGQCEQINQVPDDVPQAQCGGCGHVFVFDARLEDVPRQHVRDTSGAIQSEPGLDRLSAGLSNAPVQLPDRYADWEEFRSLSPAVQREMVQLATRALPDMRRVNLEPIPAEAPKEIDGWRRPVATLHLPGTHVLRTTAAAALMGCGLVFFIGGMLTFLDVWGERRSVGIALAPMGIGIGCVAAGAYWFIRGGQSQSVLTMWIFEEGVCVLANDFRAVRWENVHDFELETSEGRPIYRLTLPDAAPIIIDVAHSPAIMPIMEYVEARLSSSQFQHRLEAILKGKPQRFGAVALDRQGFRGPRFAAPWPEVRRVVSDGKSLLIEWTRAKDWLNVPLDRVSFPYLVMALSHVMIEEHERLPGSV